MSMVEHYLADYDLEKKRLLAVTMLKITVTHSMNLGFFICWRGFDPDMSTIYGSYDIRIACDGVKGRFVSQQCRLVSGEEHKFWRKLHRRICSISD